ncbi:MAG: hypothetical protein R3301_04015 [Saprospiraceae bacterium]|nr:hypothetical protein [Saprospiraceae bacterium]
MNTTKLVICTLVGAVYCLLIDYLFYGILMGGTEGGTPNFLWMIIGYVIFALFFCMIYAKGVEGGSPTQQGLRYGIMVGFLTAVAFGFIMHGVSTTGMMEEWSDLGTVLRDSAFEVVKLGILGVIIAHLSGAGAGDRSGPTGQSQTPPPGGGN